MDLDQLAGRYRRLKDELASAYAQQPWPTGRIDRLAYEIAETEREIAAMSSSAPASRVDSSTGAPSDDARTLAPTAPMAQELFAKSASRKIPVERNRLTPFGARPPQAAGE